MASFRDQFESYYAPSAEAVSTALHTGLVALDTNVLLSTYRLQAEARDELFRVLEQLGDQVWIPYQVALEFHQNRLNVIADQEKFFGKTRDDLDAVANDYIKKFRAFSNRIALSISNVQNLVDGMQAAHAAIRAEVSRAEQANEVHLDSHNSDEVLARLDGLFDNRVGIPMPPGELDEARKEAERRVSAKIPPGYMDRGKSDPAGDYILWKQLKQETAKRQVPVVLVTDDRKEDWFRREHGLTLGPRVELYEEMRNEAGVPFLLMTTEIFLIQAKEHLSAPVSPATVSQAKELPRSIVEERRRAAIEDQRQIFSHLAALAGRRAAIEDARRRTNELVAASERSVREYARRRSESPDAPDAEMSKMLQAEMRIELDLHAAKDEQYRLEEEAKLIDIQIYDLRASLQYLEFQSPV